MANLETEKEELSLIYQENFSIVNELTVKVHIDLGLKHATITFIIPPNYPQAAPEITAELEGVSPKPLEDFLNQGAQSMVGLSMLAYLCGMATDYINGLSDQKFVQQQEHITTTPFTRENFLLWQEKFEAELAAIRNAHPKPKTGRQMFEDGTAQ